MLRSIQKTEPLQPWIQVHPHLVACVRGERLPGEFVIAGLLFYCRMRTIRETLNWAVANGLLVVHFEDIPSGYTLTKRGRDWSPNS